MFGGFFIFFLFFYSKNTLNHLLKACNLLAHTSSGSGSVIRYLWKSMYFVFKLFLWILALMSLEICCLIQWLIISYVLYVIHNLRDFCPIWIITFSRLRSLIHFGLIEGGCSVTLTIFPACLCTFYSCAISFSPECRKACGIKMEAYQRAIQWYNHFWFSLKHFLKTF